MGSSDNQMIVRCVVPQDEDTLRTLFARGMSDAHEGLPVHIIEGVNKYTAHNLAHDFAEITQNYCAEGLRGALLVADIDGEVVGCVGLHPVELGDENYARTLSEDERHRTCELRRMTVSRDHRRKGISNLMIQELEAKARELGYDTIHLTTGKLMVAACQLYEHAGFVRGEECMTADGYPFDHYAKTLSAL